MLVAFIGMDGTGKTTMASNLARKLAASGRAAQYMYPFEYVLLKSFLTLVKKLLKTQPTGNLPSDANPLLKKSKKHPVKQIWPLIALLDNLIYYYCRIRPLLKKGTIVVCDRYFYDFATSFDYYGYSNSLFTRIYVHLIPRPDETFVLDLPPELAQSRAQELYSEYYVEQRSRYLQMAQQYHFCVLDASQEIPTVCQLAMDRIGELLALQKPEKHR